MFIVNNLKALFLLTGVMVVCVDLLFCHTLTSYMSLILVPHSIKLSH